MPERIELEDDGRSSVTGRAELLEVSEETLNRFNLEQGGGSESGPAGPGPAGRVCVSAPPSSTNLFSSEEEEEVEEALGGGLEAESSHGKPATQSDQSL